MARFIVSLPALSVNILLGAQIIGTVAFGKPSPVGV
jgi:hypothetical protein